MGKTGQDGAAVLLAMIPALMADTEFKDTLDAFTTEYRGSVSDMKKATELAAILCDNAYRRVNDKSCPAHLSVSIDSSGNVMRVSQTHLDSGSFTPDRVLAGEFTILAHTGFAKRAAPYDGCAVMVLERAGQNFRSRGRILVEHNDHAPGQRVLHLVGAEMARGLMEALRVNDLVVGLQKLGQRHRFRSLY